MLSQAYKWEAEKADGTIITSGGDLSDCVRFSLLPCKPMLQRHDVVGVKLESRFCRSFMKTRIHDWKRLPGMMQWTNGSKTVVSTEDLSTDLKVGSLIKKRHDGEQWWPIILVEGNTYTLLSEYTGKTKLIETNVFVPAQSSECLHVLVADTFRMYVRSSNGTVLITPKDYELYL